MSLRASRTGVVLTPSWLASSACTSRVPPARVPPRIAERSVASTYSWAVLDRPTGLRLLRVNDASTLCGCPGILELIRTSGMSASRGHHLADPAQGTPGRQE
jgi:hypothetical protein